MVLRPLEFVDCLLDSPYFRENLHNHEREVEGTSKSIKLLVNACKQLIERTRELSKAHRLFATSLLNFQSHFSVIGSDQTDDEADLESSLIEISTLLMQIENEREHMLNELEESFIKPMDKFRKTEIGNAKEEKKRFDKQTAKYCASLERNLGVKAKVIGDDKHLEEMTDAQLKQDYSAFVMTSMNYVKVVQEVQERKKFIVADGLLRFMNQQMTFYFLGYEIFENFKPYNFSLQTKIQTLRAAFESTTAEAENLKRRMLVNPKEYMRTSQYKGSVLTGYLMVVRKQKTVLNAMWSKHFCEYSKDTKTFKMIQYNQSNGQAKMLQNMEPFQLKSCVRIGPEVYDRRFCFTIMLKDSSQKQVQLIMQAPDENELHLWLDAMEGKQPIEHAISLLSASQGTYKLNLDGYRFIRSCINAVESRGITEPGLYRVVGLSSKVNRLLTNGLVRDITMDVMDSETDLKVITSAIKQYFRRLAEPLMTFHFYSDFIHAAKQDTSQKRASAVHLLVHRLPEDNFTLLRLLIQHLYKVACHSSQNLMTVSNLGVCFGPTLLRQREETMAAIMDIKFCNVVVEIMIEHYHQIFETGPLNANIDNLRVTSPINKPGLDEVLGSSILPVATAHAVETIPDRQTSSAGHTPLQASNTLHVPPSPTNRNAVSMKLVPSQNQPEDTKSYADKKDFKCDSLLDERDHNSSVYAVAKSLSRTDLKTVTIITPVMHRPNSAGALAKSLPPHSRPSPSAFGNLKSKGTGVLPLILGRSSRAVIGTPDSCSNSPRPSLTVPRHQSLASSSSASSLSSFTHVNTESELAINASSDLRFRANSSSAVPPYNTDANSSPFSYRRIPRIGRRPSMKAKALYDCRADGIGELSFKTGDIVENIRESIETGWLEGTVNGRFGLVPANFVVFL